MRRLRTTREPAGGRRVASSIRGAAICRRNRRNHFVSLACSKPVGSEGCGASPRRRILSVPAKCVRPGARDNYSSESLVRSSGFEPPRYCYRQPLKLVRLPVPPRPHRGEKDILTGSEEGCKPSDDPATQRNTMQRGQQAGPQVRLNKLGSRSCFRGARSPRSQNCQGGDLAS